MMHYYGVYQNQNYLTRNTNGHARRGSTVKRPITCKEDLKLRKYRDDGYVVGNTVQTE